MCIQLKRVSTKLVLCTKVPNSVAERSWKTYVIVRSVMTGAEIRDDFELVMTRGKNNNTVPFCHKYTLKYIDQTWIIIVLGGKSDTLKA